MVRSRVELFEAIRRDARLEELSIRGLADRYGVHRRTVRQALAAAEPPARKVPVRSAPRLDPAKALIDAMLREDLDAPKKQRHTARRVLDRLVEEHQVTAVGYSTVRDYVRARRPQIWAEAGRSADEVYIAQVHEPGAQAEVDFADLWVVLAGVKTKLFLFTLRLSYSGKAVHRAFASQCQEAFLEGHVYAFEQLGGVPVVHVRYDNLKSAVSRVLFGRTRVESARWVTFRSHYGFDAFYCRPGKEGAHEKGGVEVEGGRFRRNHLVPMPHVDSVAELNAVLAAADAKDDHRRVEGRTVTVGTDFALERPVLRALPGEAFETGITLTPRVDRHARVSVRQTYYSVPARFIGARVRTLLRAEEVLVFDKTRLVARHERSRVRGGQVLVLDHYLEVLARKPGALPGSMALSQARAAGVFTVAHEAFWTRARALHGDGDGTRALIEVLLLHRHLPAAAVTAGIRAGLAVGSTSPELVAVEARRAAARPPLDIGPDDSASTGAAVLVLPVKPATGPAENPAEEPAAEGLTDLVRHKLAGLPGERPLPSVAHYDQLLTRRPTRTDPGTTPQTGSPPG
ncbi:MAG TPA: IS21 family transposase [Actinomycetes bacterium]|nr:IS21 family transposase [Actinomycetes bacterium]